MRYDHIRIVVVTGVVGLSPLIGSGCTGDRSASGEGAKPQAATATAAVAPAVATPRVTVPNGSSPFKSNAPHAPMNDTESMRKGFNHGNGELWVWLPADSTFHLSNWERDPKMDGAYFVKLGWWRGHAGRFSIEGRRLDAPAPPLRSSFHPDSYGAFGFIPCYLYFPGEGYWEITGRVDDKPLTFVVHVVP